MIKIQVHSFMHMTRLNNIKSVLGDINYITIAARFSDLQSCTAIQELVMNGVVFVC